VSGIWSWRSAAAFFAVLAVVLGVLWYRSARTQTVLPSPDTPPAEYLYLDTARVLSYLGQISGGLSASEQRTDSLSDALTAGLKGGDLINVSGSRTHALSVQTVVTPSTSDRFYRLLAVLRDRKNSRRPTDRKADWLFTIDGHPEEREVFEKKTERKIAKIHEGDFVRIEDAHLFLPPFAAVFRKTRYAALYGLPKVNRYRESFLRSTSPAPLRSIASRDSEAFRRRVGRDATLPFVLPVTIGSDKQIQLTIFVPARYTQLLENARLLAGDLTVVGKVIFKDPRLPGKGSCRAQPAACRYVDVQTVSNYAPALEHAPESVRQALQLDLYSDLAAYVQDFVQFSVPVVVVLPVAIYQ
jgi:hypothetical protein